MADNLIMGFDYGTSRIGVAVGQSITGTATPLTVVSVHNGLPDWAAIGRLVQEWRPAMFVVGLPINMDGSDSDMSRLTARFARQLQGRFHIPSHTMDERLTTREARELATVNESVDAVAAKLIVESWLRQTT